jgi:predicted nucleic-acid-binding protein
MLAVDTNVLVRLLAQDHAEQTRRAEKLIRENRIWIGSTVLLETEWVLRDSYRMTAEKIEAVFRSLGGVPTIILENAEALAQALDWYAAGMDFADAFHLACSVGAEQFATFDKKLAAAARRVGATQAVSLV